MIVRGEGLMTLAGSLAVLLAIGVVGIVLTSMLFRWEGTEPIPRRSLAMIAIAFSLTLGVSALAAPAFKMGDMPGARRDRARTPPQGQVLVLRGATVLDGLGGRIVNARVVIRDHRIAEVSLDDDRVPLPEGATVENLQRQVPDPRPVRFARALGRIGRHRRRADRSTPTIAWRTIFTATLAAGVTSVVSLTDDLKEMRALSNDVAAGRAAMRRARSIRGRRSPRRAAIRRRCFRSCPGSRSC